MPYFGVVCPEPYQDVLKKAPGKSFISWESGKWVKCTTPHEDHGPVDGRYGHHLVADLNGDKGHD